MMPRVFSLSAGEVRRLTDTWRLEAFRRQIRVASVGSEVACPDHVLGTAVRRAPLAKSRSTLRVRLKGERAMQSPCVGGMPCQKEKKRKRKKKVRRAKTTDGGNRTKFPVQTVTQRRVLPLTSYWCVQCLENTLYISGSR